MRKSGLFIKILLSIIAICLIIITFTLVFQSEPTQAQGRINFNNIQIENTSGGFLILDGRTGDIWMYAFGRQQPDYIGRLTQVGSPLATPRRR
jgi:hypothetical protein